MACADVKVLAVQERCLLAAGTFTDARWLALWDDALTMVQGRLAEDYGADTAAGWADEATCPASVIALVAQVAALKAEGRVPGKPLSYEASARVREEIDAVLRPYTTQEAVLLDENGDLYTRTALAEEVEAVDRDEYLGDRGAPGMEEGGTEATLST
jgi:hypothetical protein